MKSFIVSLFCIVFPAVGAAQSIQIATQATRAESTGYVTASYNNTALVTVLDDIAERAGVHVSYNNKIVPVAARVTASLERVSVAEAFARVLKGTGLQAVQVSVREWTVGGMAVRARSVGQGVIAGKVIDGKSGKGVSGATVSVDADTRGVVSDESGAYRLAGVAAGAHTVVVRLVGYAKQTKSVSVSDGAVIAVDFKLEPSASVLDQVVVTGTVIASELRSVPNAITVITAKDIEQRGITRIDQLFRGEIPGLFSLEQGTNAQLDEVIMYSRGVTKISSGVDMTNPIKTYVDGIELANTQYLSQIDPKSIERIEILTGPQASTIYGANAINGVMQIFTKRGRAIRPSITLNLSEGFAQNNFSSAVASSHQYDGNISGTDGKISYNVGTGWDYTGAWSPSKQLQRTSAYGGSRYQFQVFSFDLSARQGWTRSKQQGDNQQVNIELASTGKFNPLFFPAVTTPAKYSLYGRTVGTTLGFLPFSWWSHQLTIGGDASNTERFSLAAGYANRADTSKSASQSTNSRISQSYSSTLTIPILSMTKTTLIYGIDHWRNRSASMDWTVRPSGQLVNPNVSRPRITTSKNSGAYAQGQVGFRDALFLTYGVRADWNPNYGEKAKVRPGRYGASYSKEFGIVSGKLRGSYGRSIRPPASGQIHGTQILPNFPNDIATLETFVSPGSSLYSILPTPELGPEFQQGGEGGVELYFGNRSSLVLTRYNQTVDGLINAISNVDSVRALQSGVATNSTSICSTALDIRSDGYCYLVQAQYLNVGSIRNQGWEMQGSINSGPFTTRGTYSWVKSRVIGVTPRYRTLLSGFTTFNPGQTFNYVPEHTWSVDVSYAHQGTSVLLNINGLGQTLHDIFVSDLGLVTASSLRLQVQETYNMGLPFTYRQTAAGYTNANINASHLFSSNLEATLQVANLTNYYHNDRYYAYPTLGRQTRLGLRWHLR